MVISLLFIARRPIMNLAEDIRPISYIKSHAAQVIRHVSGEHASVVVTQNGEAKAVIIDIASYQKLKDAVATAKILNYSAASAVRHGHISHSEVKEKFEQRFSNAAN
jgi:prevent-host-death family protein